MDLAVVLELKEEAVAPFRWELGHEGDGAIGPTGRVYVEVREVPLTQRHKVATRAQVGLNRYRLTITRHREAKLRLTAG